MTYILTLVTAAASNAAAIGVTADSDLLVPDVAKGKQQTDTSSSFMSSGVTDALISAATTANADGLIGAVVGDSFACK